MARDNEGSVLPAIHTFIHKWNEPYLLLLPSHRASLHFGWYSFPILLKLEFAWEVWKRVTTLVHAIQSRKFWHPFVMCATETNEGSCQRTESEIEEMSPSFYHCRPCNVHKNVVIYLKVMSDGGWSVTPHLSHKNYENQSLLQKNPKSVDVPRPWCNVFVCYQSNVSRYIRGTTRGFLHDTVSNIRSTWLPVIQWF